MSIGTLRFTGPWGHCLLVLGFAAFVGWYTADAYAASSKIKNLLLIGPVGLVAAVLCAVTLATQVPRLRIARSAEPAPREGTFRERWGVAAACAGLAAYVMLMPWIGFDVATALFVAAGMTLQGERRPWVSLPFGALVGALTTYAMETVLSVPVPSLVVG
ncbi:hypothetical protein DLJ53_28400 [Acuticoccus sediminis]|uniref:DUF1468 domain-containing protein n=1 Tax=Acuticoccus sediminis TaxID=2184697 RepID=A0A8B2NPQ4_9HYPH|nr:tripartite tricarboxylate transporter TctB family protein [Acuticoccus sediminis]RAH97763.1 hypothetical protein DLJ53_28400 [Acuticoccus sediminis]